MTGRRVWDAHKTLYIIRAICADHFIHTVYTNHVNRDDGNGGGGDFHLKQTKVTLLWVNITLPSIQHTRLREISVHSKYLSEEFLLLLISLVFLLFISVIVFVVREQCKCIYMVCVNCVFPSLTVVCFKYKTQAIPPTTSLRENIHEHTCAN